MANLGVLQRKYVEHWNTLKSKKLQLSSNNIVVNTILLISIKWEVYKGYAQLQGSQKNTTITLVGRKYTSCYFPVINQNENTSGDTVVM